MSGRISDRRSARKSFRAFTRQMLCCISSASARRMQNPSGQMLYCMSGLFEFGNCHTGIAFSEGAETEAFYIFTAS